jgi:hypothetical protein
MKLIYAALFSVLFLCHSKAQQIRFCGYETLHNRSSHIPSEKISLKLTAENYAVKDTDLVGLDTLVDKYKINLNPGIGLIQVSPTLATKLWLDTESDSLSVYTSRFCIRELMHNKDIGEPEIRKAYFLNQKEQKILVIIGTDVTDRAKNNWRWVLLFDVTDPDNVSLIQRDKTNFIYAFGDDFFGDFNRDGRIDFCFIAQDQTKISGLSSTGEINVFNIEGGKLIKIEDYSLKVSQKEHKYYLDRNNSKWFYKLPKHILHSNTTNYNQEKPYLYPDSKSR